MKCRVKQKSIAVGILLLALSAMAMGPRLSLATGDLLQTPAIKSPRVTTSLMVDVVNTGERLVAVGDRGHIVYSEDNGKTWIQVDCPASVLLTAVYFPDPQNGWIVGHDGLVLHSDDGGITWKKQLDGVQVNEIELTFAQQRFAAKESEITAADEKNKEKLNLELEDLQYQLEDAQIEVEQGAWKPFLDVWFKNEQEGFVIGAFGMIFHTGDGGQTWQTWRDRIENPDGYHYKAIIQRADTLYIAGELGNFYRSVDDGKTWEFMAPFYEGSFFGLCGTADGKALIAGGLRGHGFFSEDQGSSWQPLDVGIPATIAGGVALNDGTMVISTYSGHILKIDALGKTQNTEETGFPGLIAVAESADHHLIVAGLAGVRRLPIKSDE